MPAKKAATKKRASAAAKKPQTKSEEAPKLKSNPTYGEASAFKADGFEATLAVLEAEIRELYLLDEVPWIIGYSGGKDSTAVLQLIWNAIAKLSPEQCRKSIHVISTDTLVENPVVAAWVANSLNMRSTCHDNQ